MKLKNLITTPLRLLYKLLVFKLWLPLEYRLRAAGAVDDSRTVFIEVRRDGLSNNFALLWDALENDGVHRPELCCLRLGSCGALSYIKNCRAMIKRIARARYIFINEGSTVFSALPIRRETTVIQTWHGCGALKRVGMSALGNGGNVAGGRLERKLFPMCRHMDFICISSPEVAWAYEEAFDLHAGDGQRICPVGTSRTDVYFDAERIAAANARVRAAIPQSAEKKLLLYAPTFRGETTNARIPDELDIELMRESLEEEYILLIKHHPVVKEKQRIPESCRDFAFDVTDMQIDDLLMSADVCISDYSSLVFDYSLLDRPMIFFVYDMDDYVDWRGLYYPFEDFCPGKKATTTQEIIDALQSPELFDAAAMERFRARHMASCDGHCTERILALMDKTPDKNRK